MIYDDDNEDYDDNDADNDDTDDKKQMMLIKKDCRWCLL